MADSFPGMLRVRHLPSIDVVVTLQDGMLRIDAADEPLGSWPIDVCRVAPAEAGTFRMTVDGERAVFAPTDPSGFAAVAATEFRAASLADRREVMRSASVPAEEEASSRAHPASSPGRSGGAGTTPVPDDGRDSLEGLVDGTHRYRYVIFVASALLAGALAAALGLGPAGEPPPTLAGARTAASPATTTTPVDAFALTPRAFAERWNEVADELGVDLRLLGVSGSGSFEARPADRILVQGAVGVDGTVDLVVLTADPSVDAEDRRLVLASWGVLIAVAEPGLSPSGRADVLSELGIDLARPELPGLEGTRRTGRLRYSIRYLEGLDSLLFSVEEL